MSVRRCVTPRACLPPLLPHSYGPFWICATLVFVSAATGNAVQYMSYQQTAASAANAPVFNYDMAKVSVSAGVFFSYVGLYPLMLWFLLRSWGAPTDLLLMVALYGYSLFIFIPISVRGSCWTAQAPSISSPALPFPRLLMLALASRRDAHAALDPSARPPQILSVIPIDAVRWPINMAGGVISTACLVFNLRALLEPVQDGKKRSMILGFCALSQIGARRRQATACARCAAAGVLRVPPRFPHSLVSSRLCCLQGWRF